MALLQVDGLALRFGGLHVLSGVSLTVEAGTVTSVIGPNGAGKTSLFNCITGFYRPSGGTIHLQGRPIQGQPPHRITQLGLARTFQNIRLFRDMTVLENVMSGPHCRTRHGLLSAILSLPSQRREETAIRETAQTWLRFFGIERRAPDLAGGLSYGDQRRVEWARALASSPSLVLLDEPAAGLNPAEKGGLADTIRRVREQAGVTVLLIEHDMRLVMEVSDRVTVLDRGRIIAEGPPAQVQSDPAVIAAYLGTKEA